MNIPQKNNNPVNLRFAGQEHAFELEGFACFQTPMDGWRAAHRQIALDQKRGLSLKEFIFKFAPPNENNTNNYLDFVCKELNVGPDTPLAQISKFALAGVMAQEEGYYAQ
jgi:hypothetical protein